MYLATTSRDAIVQDSLGNAGNAKEVKEREEREASDGRRGITASDVQHRVVQLFQRRRDRGLDVRVCGCAKAISDGCLEREARHTHRPPRAR